MKKNLKKNLKTNQKQSQSQSQSAIWLCGKHAVFSAIAKKRRKIFSILATKNSLPELENFLKKKSLSHLGSLIQISDPQKIEFLSGHNLHQGLAINCSKLPIKNQFDLLEELHVLDQNSLPPLVLLDQISDPHNVGAIIRSAVGFGVKKIIFCEHNAPKENATIAKSAAGTLEIAELFQVTNFNNLIEKLKKIGYWIVGLAGEGKVFLSQVKDYENIALIIGSEGDGIRDLVKKNCDILAKIKINPDVESLNASVAASIALYELMKDKI